MSDEFLKIANRVGLERRMAEIGQALYGLECCSWTEGQYEIADRLRLELTQVVKALITLDREIEQLKQVKK